MTHSRPPSILVVSSDLRADESLRVLLDRDDAIRIIETDSALTDHLASHTTRWIVLDLQDGLHLKALAALRPKSHSATLAQVEREHIQRTLHATGWNKRQAARLLGIARSTLQHKVRLYDLVDPTQSPS